MTPAAAGIGAAASLLGGILNRKQQDETNAANRQMAYDNINLQKDFAQQGIRWKVEDAREAGISPHYALGAQTMSFSPVSLGQVADSSLGNSVSNMGQDISRAVNATRTQSERVDAFTTSMQGLQLEGAKLDNDIKRASLASSVARIAQSANPPIPGSVPTADKYEEAPRLNLGVGDIKIDPQITNTEDFTKRYGESADWWAGPYVAFRDYTANYGNPIPEGWGRHITPGSVADRFYTAGREFRSRFGNWQGR